MVDDDLNQSFFERNQKVIWIAISFTIALVIMLFATGYIDKIILKINPNSKLCPDGTCRDACTKVLEVRNTAGKCVDPLQVCCIKNDRPPSTECNGRNAGDSCGNMMLCDDNKVCVTRCEYCANNPDSKSCTINAGQSGNIVSKLDSEFTCGCTEMDCVSFDNSRLGTCVKGFCPNIGNIAATDHMCCKSPYKKTVQ